MPGKLKVVAGKLKRLWDRPAFSNVVALMALFVALGGASYAAIKVPKNSVGTRQIKNRAVTAAKLRKNSVNSAKVRNRLLRAVDFRKGQLPRGATGPLGPVGPPGATGLAGEIGPTGLQGAIGLPGATGEAGPQGVTGEAGPQGVTGDAGPQGATGETGATGATGLSTTAVMTGYTSLPTGGSRVFGVSGVTSSADPNSPFPVVMRTPGVAVTAANLSVSVDVAPGTNANRYFALTKVSQTGELDPTFVACNISNSSTACSPTVTSVVIPANTLIVMYTASTFGSPAATGVHFGFTIGP